MTHRFSLGVVVGVLVLLIAPPTALTSQHNQSAVIADAGQLTSEERISLQGTWVSTANSPRLGTIVITLKVTGVNADGTLVGSERTKTKNGRYGPWDFNSDKYFQPAPRAEKRADGSIVVRMKRKSPSQGYMETVVTLHGNELLGTLRSPNFERKKTFIRK